MTAFYPEFKSRLYGLHSVSDFLNQSKDIANPDNEGYSMNTNIGKIWPDYRYLDFFAPQS